MPERKVRKELRDAVENCRSDPDIYLALEGLYKLYFGQKAGASTDEREYLLIEGHRYSVETGIPYAKDKEIFAKAAAEHLKNAKREP